MQVAILIFCILIFLALIVLMYLYMQPREEPGSIDQSQKIMLELMENMRKEVQESGGKNRQEMQTRLDKITEQISSHQKNTSDNLQKQFNQSARIIKEVTEKLTSIEGTNKQVLGFAEQMKSLEKILQNPKQRGVLGEYFLEALLGNVLQPNQYKMQYRFESGEIVDAAIFFKESIIPIDAKFSLEKYNQMVQTSDKERRAQLEKEFKGDIKNRIDETAKYIRPNEGTTEFAFMFIPAEGIYYNLLIYNVGTVNLNTKDLVEYAFRKHVIIVSPTSFYAYLETVLQGLKALKIEESVKDVIKRVEKLGDHLNSYQTSMTKLGNHLGTTVNMYNSASREFKKIDKDVIKITDGNGEDSYETMELDKPHKEIEE